MSFNALEEIVDVLVVWLELVSQRKVVRVKADYLVERIHVITSMLIHDSSSPYPVSRRFHQDLVHRR